MRLKNCSGNQDTILTRCESFGGAAAEAAAIAQELDAKLTEAQAEIESLNERLTNAYSK